jgi:SOS-response transcriptional repressor LexA
MQYMFEYPFDTLYPPAYSCRMDISSRLDKAMKEAGFVSQSALARASGVPQPTINRILKRTGTKGPEADTVRKLAAACNVSFDWLNEEVGPKERGPSAGDEAGKHGTGRFDTNVKAVALGGRPIPVISPVQAGKLKEITDPYSPGAGFAVEYVDESEGYSPWAFALEIDGYSMMPDFPPGDRVIIDPEIVPNPGDFVVARNTKEEATFKKYRPRGIDAKGNMIFELVPLNPDYPTMRSDVEHLQVIGTMVEHRKKRRHRK